MSTRNRVVTKHLEGISRSVLKDSQGEIASLVKGQSGIYALYKNDNLYYVGLASNLFRRLKQHLRDRHARKWNRFSIYTTVHNDQIKELESLLLRIVNPRGNNVTGKFARSKNLRPVLNKLLKDRDDDRRSAVMGGHQRKRRVKSKAGKLRGSGILAGAFDRAVPLRGYRGDYEYRGSLRKNGQIYYDGICYSSPGAAASAALGKRANGWAFWRYRDKNGEWKQLKYLKR